MMQVRSFPLNYALDHHGPSQKATLNHNAGELPRNQLEGLQASKMQGTHSGYGHMPGH